MRVFLTGGTGLVGSHAAAALAAAGHEVVALARPESDTRALAGVARLVVGDLLGPPERLSGLMAGCDAIVHSAALVYRRGASWAEYERLNVTAAEQVLRAAGAAGARRALLVSSIAVYGPAAAASGYVEESWLSGPLAGRWLYARSKRGGEEAAWRLHEAGVVRLTTVRPGVVYGERDRLFTPMLARVTGWPVVPLPGGGRTSVAVVYAGNVARGLVWALERESAVGEAFNLSADAGLCPAMLVELLARGLGRTPRLLAVPGVPLTWLAALGDVVARVMPVAAGADLQRSMRLMLRDNPYPDGKAGRLLGWTAGALVPASEALERTARWWRSRHGS